MQMVNLKKDKIKILGCYISYCKDLSEKYNLRHASMCGSLEDLRLQKKFLFLKPWRYPRFLTLLLWKFPLNLS